MQNILLKIWKEDLREWEINYCIIAIIKLLGVLLVFIPLTFFTKKKISRIAIFNLKFQF